MRFTANIITLAFAAATAVNAWSPPDLNFFDQSNPLGNWNQPVAEEQPESFHILKNDQLQGYELRLRSVRANNPVSCEEGIQVYTTMVYFVYSMGLLTNSHLVLGLY